MSSHGPLRQEAWSLLPPTTPSALQGGAGEPSKVTAGGSWFLEPMSLLNWLREITKEKTATRQESTWRDPCPQRQRSGKREERNRAIPFSTFLVCPWSEIKDKKSPRFLARFNNLIIFAWGGGWLSWKEGDWSLKEWGREHRVKGAPGRFLLSLVTCPGFLSQRSRTFDIPTAQEVGPGKGSQDLPNKCTLLLCPALARGVS